MNIWEMYMGTPHQFSPSTLVAGLEGGRMSRVKDRVDANILAIFLLSTEGIPFEEGWALPMARGREEEEEEDGWIFRSGRDA
jgi:hypothetical protein